MAGAMNPLKKLAGQTAIYGLGTLVPRLLNYLLVPLYTRLFLEDEYGIITELYSWIAFFFVVLLYGMETTFFRFASKEPEPKRVFSTSLFSVLISSLLFLVIVLLFITPISSGLRYPDHKDFIIYSAIIVSLDAITAIPFAFLRHQNRPVRFSVIRIISVAVNIGLNLYFIWFCNSEYRQNPDSVFLFLYDPNFRVGYVFVANLVASIITAILLAPQYIKLKAVFDPGLLKRMLFYTFPLLIVGLAGMVNEVWDKIIFKYLVRIPADATDPESFAMGQLGIYGANYKLAVLMTLFVQMFRFAAEPFFFSQSKEGNAKQIYADVLKYFVIFGLFIFLTVTLYLDIFKYFIGPKHWEGLYIVPIILLANLLLGIFFNLSIWYKLQDMTRYGAKIALGGAVITILANILLVPSLSYLGAAWGHLACYTFMVVLSYYQGQKYYRINYDLAAIFLYFIAALGFFAINYYINTENLFYRLIISSALLLAFLSLVYLNEKFKLIRSR
ncbi:MAG: polysaccharide biosynthesis protein [Bacteroidetes bacterium]|nr:polysaccharide biosynthesis protein [Bacteroidota bacterium]